MTEPLTNLRMLFLLLILLLADGLLTGCGSQPSTSRATADLSHAGFGLAGIADATANAETHTKLAIPHADAVGQTELHAVQIAHTQVDGHVSETTSAISQLQADLSRLQKQLDALTEKYAALEGRWYVTLGRWSERLFWFLLSSWILFGILGVVSASGTVPFLPPWLSTEVFHLLPLMNPFHWLMLFFSRVTASPAAASPPPSGFSPQPTPTLHPTGTA